jgi:hypothetical protein
VSNDTECRAVFTSPYSEIEVSWTIADATRAGLVGKNTWRGYPRSMLRARCISEGIRAVNPGCVCGIYTPEEVADFDAVPAQTANPEHAEPLRRIEVKVAPMTAPEAAESPVVKRGAPPAKEDLDNLRTELAEMFPALSDSKEHVRVAAGRWMDFCSRHAGRTIRKAGDLTAAEVLDVRQALKDLERAEPGCDDDKDAL